VTGHRLEACGDLIVVVGVPDVCYAAKTSQVLSVQANTTLLGFVGRLED
jgi:hypothetical protein